MAAPHICSAQHSGWLTLPVRKLFNHPRRILAGLVHPGDVVIDLGCGPGYFTLPLADMVGGAGQVIAVDVQREMLDQLQLRAERAGLAGRIRGWLVGGGEPDTLGPADFVLAFWMLHEVPDQAATLAQVREWLKPQGRLLLVEPAGHVGKAAFAGSMERAQRAGFVLESQPRVGFSRAALLRRS